MTYHYTNPFGKVRGEREYLVIRMIDLARERKTLLNFIDCAVQNDTDAEIDRVYALSDQIEELRARLDRLAQLSDETRAPDQN